MDPRHLEHGHNSRDIARRLRRGPQVSYLRDWVYGGIDGTVTTFAVVAGVAGAELSIRTLLIPGRTLDSAVDVITAKRQRWIET